MDFSQIFQAVLSLIFVLGLLLVVLSFIKICQKKGMALAFLHKSEKDSAFKIIEQKRLDAKNSLVLIEYQNTQFLLLLGAEQNLMIKETPLSAAKESPHA